MIIRECSNYYKIQRKSCNGTNRIYKQFNNYNNKQKFNKKLVFF